MSTTRRKLPQRGQCATRRVARRRTCSAAVFSAHPVSARCPLVSIESVARGSVVVKGIGARVTTYRAAGHAAGFCFAWLDVATLPIAAIARIHHRPLTQSSYDTPCTIGNGTNGRATLRLS